MPGLAQHLEVVGDGRLREVEQRDQLADADLAGVLAQDVDELQADGSPSALATSAIRGRVLALDVGVDDRLAAGLAGGALLLGGKLQIDGSSIYGYRLK